MTDWHKASCKDHDPSLWDTEHLGPGTQAKMLAREKTAKRICSTCPIIHECRLYGLEVVIKFDSIQQIYGGLNPGELAEAVGAKKVFVSGIQTFRG